MTTDKSNFAPSLTMGQLLCNVMDGLLQGRYTLHVGTHAPHRVLHHSCPVSDEYRIDTDDWMEEFFGVRELEDMQIIVVNETLVCMNRHTASQLISVSGEAFLAVFKVSNNL